MRFIISLLILVLLVGKSYALDIDLHKISMIESSNDPLAYNSGHVGMFQISQGIVTNYNYENNVVVEYNLDDMYIPTAARLVAEWYLDKEIPKYLKAYDIPDTITSRLIAWNWGIGHLRRWFKHGCHWNQLPHETRNYIKKYFREDD